MGAMNNFLKGMNMPHPHQRAQLARVVVAASVAAGAGVALHARRSGRPGVRPKQPQGKFLIPQPAVDAICGAVGEVSQIVLLYPLETIKVRCQADGISAAAVVRAMLKNGWGPEVVRQLYSGIGSATAFSVVVGAIHWLTFCTAKRASLEVMQQQELEQRQLQGAAAAAAGCKTTAASGISVHTSAGGTAHLHVSSGHHMHDENVQLRAGGSEGGGGHGHGGGADGSDVRMLASANMVGATVGAVFTALVEGPLELFRHQAQAGLISGNLFKEMGNVVKARGPMGIYWGFLPYCLESFPYDISELSTYSQLRDVYNQAVSRADPTGLFGAKSKVPSQMWDIAIGAAAGSAATLISMPFDVVKTYMQTHTKDAITLSALGQVTSFFRTGAWMVAKRGPGALWVGVVPRLAQQVPSCTICWWAVEACQQALKPITAT